MIDKFFYWFFSQIDKYTAWIDSAFVEFPKSETKKNECPNCGKDFGCRCND